MSVKRTRLGRTGLLLASLALMASACGEQSPGASSPDDAAPDDSAATSAGSNVGETLGDYEGLCSWASPDDLAQVFGEPVDALGGTECRVVPADETGSEGFYHLRLDQAAGYDELERRLVDNQKPLGFKICDQETTRWQGMRISRRVTCPTAGGEDDDFEPQVTIEVGRGRALINQPYSADSKKAAQEASHRFVEIMKAFAKGGSSLPVINEFAPGDWLEIYNPTDTAIDLSGYTVVASDDLDEELQPKTTTIDPGTTVQPRDRVVVDITELKGFRSDFAALTLSGGDGGFVDYEDFGSADKGEVVRRDGDGGLFCAFGSPQVTQDKPNPRGCD